MNLHQKIILSVFVLVLLKSTLLQADNTLLYFEAQGVASYRAEQKEFVWYSHHQHETMQKPSLGFDFVRRIRATGRDRGYLAIQARIAFDEHKSSKLEPQLYNAFYNLKIMRSDLWIGHNKTALGLSSYLDNHALLMPDNSMSPLNFDRDWGIGFYTEKQFTDYRVSLTTGSGMPLYVKDNYLVAGRIGIGDLDRDNRNFGFSVAQGQILKTMGYHYMHDKKIHNVLFGGFDTGIRYLNKYLMADLIAGRYDDQTAYASLLRTGINLLPDDRMNLEAQVQLLRTTGSREELFAGGFSYRLTPYLTFRTLFEHNYRLSANNVTMQLYYLRGFVF